MSGDGALDVSVIVPCYNEEASIEPTLVDLVSVLDATKLRWQVLVVDDGSRDRSAAIVQRFTKEEPRVTLVRHLQNMGSGQAIWSGVQHASGEFVIYVPADGQFDMGEIPMFHERAEAGADIVIGHRLSRHDYTRYRLASSFVFLTLCNALFDHEFQDINWVHLWRRSIFEQIDPKSRGVFFLEEILVRARQHDMKIVEVRSAYRPRRGGKAKGGHPVVILKTIWDMLALWTETR